MKIIRQPPAYGTYISITCNNICIVEI